MLTEDEIKEEARNAAVHADGTEFIFQRRLRNLRRKTNIRDFLSVVVPLLIAFTYQTDWIQSFPNLRTFLLSSIGFLALAQAAIAFWSLVAKWDDDRAYAARAVRDSEEMRSSWSDLAKGIADNSQSTFVMLNKQQALINSHDTGKEIKVKEKQLALRYALINARRPCVCGQRPEKRTPPWIPNHPCPVCGGN